MEERKIESKHKIVSEGREKLNVSGVEDVDSFDENEIRVYTTEGLLTVKGVELHMSSLCLENGEMAVEGEIDALIYSGESRESGGFFSKLFK